MIYPCTCKNEFQDMVHGKGRRVYNIGKTVARCSVCKKETPLTSEQIKNKNQKGK